MQISCRYHADIMQISCWFHTAPDTVLLQISCSLAQVQRRPSFGAGADLAEPQTQSVAISRARPGSAPAKAPSSHSFCACPGFSLGSSVYSPCQLSFGEQVLQSSSSEYSTTSQCLRALQGRLWREVSSCPSVDVLKWEKINRRTHHSHDLRDVLKAFWM